MAEEIICYCSNVSRSTIEKAIRDGAKSLNDIRWATEACKGNECKDKHPRGICCSHEIKKMILEFHGNDKGSKCSCCG